jgi:hypothetical protein
MPSILTHHLFGQKVLEKYGRAFEEKADTRDAFMMGCQGPDPFFFAALGPRPKEYYRFGQLLHGTNVTRSFDSFFRYAENAPGKEREILRAYLTGYLCHYSLDRTAHPYVFAVQYEETKKLGLDRDQAHIHMRLETVIDSLLTGEYENPDKLMPLNKRVCLAISKMYERVAAEVYGLSLSKRCFWRAIRCTRVLERFLKSKSGVKRSFFVRVERLFNKYSIYDAMSHSRDLKGLKDPLNLQRRKWISTAAGTVHTETFCELFSEGLERAVDAIHLLQKEATATEITSGVGFDGTEETITPPNQTTNS